MWTSSAAAVKAGANKLLWNEGDGLYRDNETTLLTPQDGNMWAIISNLTESDSQIELISATLAARWGKYGAPAPEAGVPTVSPFIGGSELIAHYMSGNPQRAIELMHREWDS